MILVVKLLVALYEACRGNFVIACFHSFILCGSIVFSQDGDIVLVSTVVLLNSPPLFAVIVICTYLLFTF